MLDRAGRASGHRHAGLVQFSVPDTGGSSMSLRLVKAVAETENLDDFHLGRLLVLLGSADARRNTAATKPKAVEGITKLAKLDFLLRYPTCLERALAKLGRDPAEAG